MKQMFQAMAVGVFSGVIGTAFSFVLEQVTLIHSSHPLLILGMPVVGGVLFNIGRFFRGPDPMNGFNRILWHFGSGSVSHLVGASVGREGAIVRMSTIGSRLVGTVLSPKLPHSIELNRYLGLAGGFAAAIGQPFTGVFFAWERGKNPGWFHAGSILVCATVAAYSARLLGTSFLQIPPLSPITGFWSPAVAAAILGLTCGGIGQLFVTLKTRLESHSKWLPDTPIRGWLGGTILLLLLAPDGMHLYRGLGIETIGSSFTGFVSWETPALKLVFTLLSLAFAFSGGEFIPLVFIGATTGNVLNQWIPLDSALLPSLGAAVVFGAAARLPITACALSCFWSGPEILPWALLAHGVAALVSVGGRSIYGETYWTSKRSPER
jgi:H+/Cl- antiporter ClcA